MFGNGAELRGKKNPAGSPEFREMFLVRFN